MSSVKTSPTQAPPVLSSSAVEIDILVVIDTDAVRDYCKQKGYQFSKNIDQPIQLPHKDLQLQYMICTGARAILGGQGTGDLSFQANPQDYVRFRGTTVYGNTDDAIIIYGITPTNNNPNVFNDFHVSKVTIKGAVVPDASKPNGLPPLTAPVTYFTYGAEVTGSGTELFWVQFALYELDAAGENQVLVGYFEWDPTITVG